MFLAKFYKSTHYFACQRKTRPSIETDTQGGIHHVELCLTGEMQIRLTIAVPPRRSYLDCSLGRAQLRREPCMCRNNSAETRAHTK